VFLVLCLAACAPRKILLYEAPSSTRADVVRTALAMQGKPYRSGAKGPDFFDCSGLVYYAYKQSGIFLPLGAEDQGNACYEVAPDGVRPADLVLFKIGKDLHIGIMVTKNEFVHASKSRGVVVDHVDSAYWRRRLVGYRAVP